MVFAFISSEYKSTHVIIAYCCHKHYITSNDAPRLYYSRAALNFFANAVRVAIIRGQLLFE